MKLKNLSIANRLFLGFGIILSIVILLGVMAYLQSEKLWQNTNELYQHPFSVSKATRDIRANIQYTRILMLEISKENNQENITSLKEKIDSVEVQNSILFGIIYDRYLGPKLDVDNLLFSYEMYKHVYKETIRLKRLGNDQIAEYRSRMNNIGGIQANTTLTLSDKLISFSNAKADHFYESSKKEKLRLANRLIVFLIIYITLTVLIGAYLIYGIRKPLRILKKAADHFGQGNYNARSEYSANNEFGNLSNSFNQLAESVQNELSTNEYSAQLAEVILIENDIDKFSQALLNSLCSKTNSQLAALFLFDEKSSNYNLQASLGINEPLIRSFSSKTFEGETGTVLLDKKIKIIKDIPEDTIMLFNTSAGTFKPKEIITIPILNKNEVIAVISLSSIYKYSDSSVKLLHQVWNLINVRIAGILLFEKIQEYSIKLDQQNRSLADKSKELNLQTDELKEYTLELELQKKQLKEANQLKSSFLSNMSHELRTPLNSVIALSGVLNKRLKNTIPEEEYKYIDIIEKNGRNLLYLINDILDLSKIEAGWADNTYSHFSLHDTVESILSTFINQVEEKKLMIINNIDNDFPIVYNDRGKFQHILQNLIGNAVKFTEQGSIEISVIKNRSDLIISVKDSGIGIEENKLEYIFDEFRQADDTNAKKYGGTGLGLAIAKKYCELLGGNIHVESKLNMGSTFSISIPIKEYEGQDIHEINSSVNLPLSSEDSIRNKNILIVEDSEPAIVQLTEILKEIGTNIFVARNGFEALELLKTLSPDSIILDLMMPEMDGFELIAKIRSTKETVKTPVLILTAKHITSEELSTLKGNNISQLVQKGDINKKDLMTHIRKMIQKSNHQKEELLEQRSSTSKKNNKPVILVIDDMPDNFETVRAILGENYIVNTASHGSEGVQMAQNEPPDIILLDVSLPGIDGIQVLDLIKGTEILKGIPVIAYTAKAMVGDKEELINMGFDDYISKPIDVDNFEYNLKTWIK